MVIPYPKQEISVSRPFAPPAYVFLIGAEYYHRKEG
jgi:hypothetical protein